MKKFYISILILIFYQNGYSQLKDTIYIYFDSIHSNMKKSSSVIRRVVKEDERMAYSYYIGEKAHNNDYGYDTGYTFYQYNRPENAIKKFGGKQPLTIEKDICYLKKYKILDTNFFKETEYIKVCKTFEAEDSWDQDVIIFVIDKDEIKNGKMILREVTFSRPAKE